MGSDAQSSLAAMFKGGGVIFGGSMVGLVVSFVISLTIARSLGPDGYGAIALGVTLVMFVSTVTLAGLSEGISRFLPRYNNPDIRRSIIISAFQLSVPFSIVTSGLLIWFAEPLTLRLFNDPGLIPVFRIFSFGIPMLVIVHLAIGTSQGNKRSAPAVFLEQGILRVGLLTFVAISIFLGTGFIGVAWAHLGAYALAGLAALYYLWKQTSIAGYQNFIPMRRELFIFSAPVMVSGTMGQLLEQVDTFLLGFFVSTSEVGIYKVIYPIGTLLFVFLVAVEFLILPILSEKHAGGEFDIMAQIYQVSTKWAYILIFPLFLLLTIFPERILQITFGAGYIEGSLALSILAFGFMTHVVTGPNNYALAALGQTKYLMICDSFAAILNIVLNLYLIPQYSYLGAAIATAVSYSVLNVMLSTKLMRSANIHPVTRNYLGTIGVSIGMFVLLFLLREYLPESRYAILLLAPLVFTLYLIIVVISIGLQEVEAALLLSIEDSIDFDLKLIRQAIRYFK